ncbi:MAG: hypothetical protein JOZ38_10775, partial [Candidatus Eremiobacteraeota bacterium]|nr:hypothetical protein [Candidatus Eremiobacteraeota bacterium]
MLVRLRGAMRPNVQRLAPLPRAVITAIAVALAYALARMLHASAFADALVLGVIVAAAALTGPAFGSVGAVLGGVADAAARIGVNDPAPWPSGIAVAVAGVALAVAVAPRAERTESGEVALPRGLAGNGRTALPRAESVAHIQSGIAMLASGIREVSQGDFTKNLAVADGSLSELAVALNKLIFSLREFLGGMHGNAKELGGSGQELQETASTALAVIEGAAVAQGQLDEGIHEQSTIVESATRKVQSLASAITTVASSAEEQTRSLDETALSVSNMATSIEQVTAQVDSLSTISLETSKTAEQGGTAIHTIVEGMDTIRSTIRELAGDI